MNPLLWRQALEVAARHLRVGWCSQGIGRWGHEVIYAGDWPQDPGDEQILKDAFDDGRILVTLDKDFGELAMVHGLPHAGIVRLVNMSAKLQAAICLQVLKQYGSELQAGAIVTAEPGYAKIRPPENKQS